MTRNAGSRGIWDLVGIRLEDPSHPVMFVQCKRVETKAQARSLINKFTNNPPIPRSPHWKLFLEIQIKESREVMSVEL